MGLSVSKKIERSLSNSLDFETACVSAYEASLSRTQHAFAGIKPYQLLHACTQVHHTLSTINPLVQKWVQLPPNQAEVDKALRTLKKPQEEDCLDLSEFRELCVQVFKDVIVGNAEKVVLQRVQVGVAGIAGIGIVTRSGRDLVGMVMGVYAIGIATAVYLSF